jgi:ribonuclease P protein component
LPEKLRTETLVRATRIRRRTDYLAVQQGGRRLRGDHYLLFALGRASDARPRSARIGVTVSRKVGGAVVRNRVKRFVRESYRRLAWMAPEGTDLVVVARPQAAMTDYHGTAEELRGLLKRIGPS